MGDQLSLADGLVDPRLGANAKLERIYGLIDWSWLEPLLAGMRSRDTGRPPYAALSMLKALYLQALYDLSDPGLEDALLDRLSFRRFCGFALDAATPDETTICRFRAAVAKASVLDRCLEEINRLLDARGLMLCKGTLMDATLVKATHNPPGSEVGSGGAHPREPGPTGPRRTARTISAIGSTLASMRDRGSSAGPASRPPGRPNPMWRTG